MEVAIIGAGIGGLTLALYLKRQGIKPVIYESAAAIEPAGAGIMLAYNAMQVLEDLGLAESIIAAGNKIKGFEISDQKERLIMATSLDQSDLKKGIYNVAIHRADLQQILATAVGIENIRLSSRLQSIETGAKTKLVFEDGYQATCDILFGADGIKSAVRNHIAPKNSLRSTRQVCWRGICTKPLPDLKKDIAIEQWGQGQRFGYVLLNPGQTYWFAVSNEQHVQDCKLPERLQSFNSVARQLISDTSPTKIIYSEIADLSPLSYWYKENICLIGDAAHATTPNMGQGGCQAIEDAYTIGKLLEQGYALKDTFPLLQQLRGKRVKKIVQQSRLIGSLSQLENKYAASFRNFALRLSAASVAKKQLNFIINLDYI